MTVWAPLLNSDAAAEQARLARTALAASSFLVWEDEEHQLKIPFVEEAGSPLLMVDREVSAELMAVGVGHVELDLDGPVRSVRLAGAFWTVANVHAEPIVEDLQRSHAMCADCPGRRATHLVGLQVDQVELCTSPYRYRWIELDAYEQAQPDELLAAGLRLVDHLNTDHALEVLRAASAMTLVPARSVAAARIEWVDSTGLELLVIDGDGSHRVRSSFSGPVADASDLQRAVRRWLSGPIG